MPFAMAMIILRRALFPEPRDVIDTPLAIKIAFGRRRVILDSVGDWD